MPLNIPFNNNTYTVPQQGENYGWGGDVTTYLQALSISLAPGTGLFPLTAELSFGDAFGVQTAYIKSNTANPAAAGKLRLARPDSISWRNNANSADLALTVNASNELTFNGFALSVGLAPNTGLFQLTAELDFGTLFGIKSLYYKSRTANPATVGALRLANFDTIAWRNNANNGDMLLSVSATNVLTYSGGVAAPSLTISGATTTGSLASTTLNVSGATTLAQVTATNFVGPGTGLTGFATGLGIGGNAATASNADAVNGITGWTYGNFAYNPPYLWATAGSAGSQFLVQPGNLTVNYANGANYASNAGNSSYINGALPVYNNAGNRLSLHWDGSSIIAGVDANYFGGTAPMNVRYAVNAGNANTFQGQGTGYFINNASTAVVNIRNSGASALIAGISGFGDVAWFVNPVSDVRLKENIKPTMEDSLEKVKRIAFKQFNFKRRKGDIQYDDGHTHKLGGIAQDYKEIDPEWISEDGDFLQVNVYPMLMAALHAIQQLEARVAELEAK